MKSFHGLFGCIDSTGVGYSEATITQVRSRILKVGACGDFQKESQSVQIAIPNQPVPLASQLPHFSTNDTLQPYLA
jgi:hypothetical protein